MKPTNFAYYLTNFLSRYLPGILGLSQNTIMSYRDTFSLFLNFCSKNKKIKPEKVSLEHLNRKLIEEYLEWLEKTRKCIASTRNVRLAAFHSFCRYLQMEFPDFMHPAQQILSIPMKKNKKISVEYIVCFRQAGMKIYWHIHTLMSRFFSTMIHCFFEDYCSISAFVIHGQPVGGLHHRPSWATI